MGLFLQPVELLMLQCSVICVRVVIWLGCALFVLTSDGDLLKFLLRARMNFAFLFAAALCKCSIRFQATAELKRSKPVSRRNHELIAPC